MHGKYLKTYIYLSFAIEFLRLGQLLPPKLNFLPLILPLYLLSFFTFKFISLAIKSFSFDNSPFRVPFSIVVFIFLSLFYPILATFFSAQPFSFLDLVGPFTRHLTFSLALIVFYIIPLQISDLLKASRLAFILACILSLAIVAINGYPGVNLALALPYILFTLASLEKRSVLHIFFSLALIITSFLSVKRLWIVSIIPFFGFEFFKIIANFTIKLKVKLGNGFNLLLPVVILACLSVLSSIFNDLNSKFAIDYYGVIMPYFSFFLDVINPFSYIFNASIHAHDSLDPTYYSLFDSGRSVEYLELYKTILSKPFILQLFGTGFSSNIGIYNANFELAAQSWVHSSLLTSYNQIGILPTIALYGVILNRLPKLYQVSSMAYWVIICYITSSLFQDSLLQPLFFAPFFLLSYEKNEVISS